MGKVACDFCGVACTSPRSLCEHVLGQKHRVVLSRMSSAEVEQLGRLQYFVDTYLKTFPILGLEYVVETQEGPSYRYTCLLCNKEHDWDLMVAHITDVDHTRAYINRHHSEITSSNFSQLSKEQQLQELKLAAQTLHNKYGHRQICTKKPGTDDPDPATAGASPREGGKRNGDASVGNYLEHAKEGALQDSAKRSEAIALQQGLEDKKNYTSQDHHCSLCGISCTSFMSLSAHLMGAKHRQSVEAHKNKNKASKIQIQRCSLCGINCSSIVAMSEHVMGSKHSLNVEARIPSQLSEVGRLGHFIDTYMMEEPILGLEYIKEFKLSSIYKYSCQLCKVDGKLQKIVAHLIDVEHVYRYIKKHHSSMLHLVPRSTKRALFAKALRGLAEKILDRQWRKDNKVENTAGSTRPESFPVGDGKRRNAFECERGDAPPSRHDGGSSSRSRRRPLPYQEEIHNSYGYKKTLTISDGPPPAKRGRLLPEEDQESLPFRPHTSRHQDLRYNERHAMELQVASALQELEFYTNNQFFEYLANFKINDYHDVDFVQRITQNCIKALKRFREEEAGGPRSSNQPEALLAHTSRADQEIPDTSVNKAPSSISEALSLNDTSNPPSNPIPQNEVTDFFFSSIKNMDESEVVAIFRKIATTNPEFQRMNIPSVIRYLKDSGKLNTP